MDEKVATLVTKAELKAERDKITKLQAFDSSYFRSKSQFEENGSHNYLVFQPMSKYFKRIIGVGNGNYIYLWKSKSLSEEDIRFIIVSNYLIYPEWNYFGTKVRLKFNESCLKQNEITCTHGTIVNTYIVYEIRKFFLYK